jgi:hypothetical protein
LKDLIEVDWKKLDKSVNVRSLERGEEILNSVIKDHQGLIPDERKLSSKK